MTPYARRSTRLTRQREAENAAWALRGDTRRTGIDAAAHMAATLYANAHPKIFVDLLRDILKPFVKRIQGPT